MVVICIVAQVIQAYWGWRCLVSELKEIFHTGSLSFRAYRIFYFVYSIYII